MKNKFIVLGFLCLTNSVFAQNADIGKVLNRLNSNKIPYAYSNQFGLNKNTIFLDAREWDEYAVSKIPDAYYVGFNSFELAKIKTLIPNKDSRIVVYCSIGVRSERIAEKIKKAGYNNVFNLWGGIFEWKNNGKTVVDLNEKPTERVHAYSKKWGVYLENGIRVYQ
ncbi:rhodanese-like domain-containing protein [Daejeonella sp.]|uniref:rhodanese-like domain-containing protein n=1 Tax=Daejeonella sp. TaxID=2805397 RepID=UPI003982E99A